MSSIEWGGFPAPLNESNMSAIVLDPGQAPKSVLDSSQPFDLKVEWDVPPVIRGFINAGHRFRLRAYAESIGPGPEIRLLEDQIAGVPGLATYSHTMTIPANTLLGEGQLDPSGNPVSGVYKLVCVLQVLNSPLFLESSGFGEYSRHVMFRAP